MKTGLPLLLIVIYCCLASGVLFADTGLPATTKKSVNSSNFLGQKSIKKLGLVAASVNSCSPPADFASGLKAKWLFSNNYLDSSSNGNNGLDTNTTFGPDRFGTPNSATVFTGGTDSYIAIADTPSLRPTTAITITAWINPSAFGTARSSNTIIGNESWGNGPGSYGYILRCGGNGYLSWNTGDGSAGTWTEVVSSPNAIHTNTWQQVVGLFTGTKLKLYVNGRLIGSINRTAPLVYNNFPIWIGQFPNQLTIPTQSRAFKGSIDDVKIYGRALSDCEVDSLYRLESKLSKPVISQGRTVTGCAGTKLLLSVANPAAGQVYEWSPGGLIGDSVLVPLNSAAVVPFTVSIQGLNLTSDTTILTIKPAPNPPTITQTGPLSICPGDSIQITATGGTAWYWNTGQTSQSIYAKQAGVYSVSTVSNGCTSTTASITVKTILAPVLADGPGATNIPFDFNTVGVASLLTPPATYRVTINTPHQIGDIWNQHPIDLKKPFDFQFTYKGCGGADGITFVLQREGPNVLSTIDGGACGYEGDTAAFPSGSIGVKLHKYLNKAEFLSDPFTVDTTTFYSPPSCIGFPIRATWDPGTQNFRFYLSGQLLFNRTINLITTIGSDTGIYFGFTGSTGGVTMTSDITVDSLKASTVRLLDSTICFQGANTRVYINNPQPNYTYLWSDGSTGTSLTVANPGYYSVRAISNGCTSAVSQRLHVINSIPAPTLSYYPGHTDSIICNTPGSAYIWYYNGAIIPTSGRVLLVDGFPGNYKVAVVIGACTSAISANFVVGIQPNINLGKNPVIAPNPFTSTLNIDCAGLNLVSANVIVTDGLGRQVHAETIQPSEGKTELNLGHLPNGIYILQLNSDSKTVRFKVVKN